MNHFAYRRLNQTNMTNMGARVARMFRNVNLETRVQREISKEKPKPAPRHALNVPLHLSNPQAAEVTETIHQKDEPLLSRLKFVFVESKDPITSEVTKEVVANEEERRPLRISLHDPYGLVKLTDVPKGKLSIVEALKALNSHKMDPKMWTPEKIAQEYSLNLKDTMAFVQFFIPFDVKIIPPKTGNVKQIKGS